MTSWTHAKFLILVTFLALTYDIMVMCKISYFSNFSTYVWCHFLQVSNKTMKMGEGEWERVGGRKGGGEPGRKE